jgi:hypothetical protein
MKRFFPLHKPKIWCLTSVYILKNAIEMTEEHWELKAHLKLSSSVMTALTNVHIGPELSGGLSKFFSSEMVFEGWKVWAARYELLDVSECQIRLGP